MLRLFLTSLVLATTIVHAQPRQSVTIGSKNFTESRLLAEIMAQAIENESDLTVERRLGLGGTMICFAALREGALDLYAEYTGTGLVAILEITQWSRLAPPVLWIIGVIQTVPSLALLAFMIPLLGLGFPAAIAALFLYALLPIVHNTYTGIRGVDSDLLEAARGMGITRWQILRLVQLPLATTTIMAGVRTSTVIGVGVTTLAAFVGAGGLGEPILTGLQLNDVNLILTGAIPAALLAIVVDLSLGGLERFVAPRGL